MPLPPTRYIDAGPGVPMADNSSSMAQAKAYANMGSTIAALGESGMAMAGRIRKIEETGKMSALFANMEKDAADFQISLMTREDTSAWPAEWRKRADKWRAEADKQGFSPEMKARFEESFMDWDTRKSISFETQAATKAVEIGRARISNSMAFHMDQGNYESAQRDAGAALESGLINSAEHEKLQNEIYSRQRHDAMLQEIAEDPAGWLEENPADKPAQGYRPDKWSQLQNHAQGLMREQTTGDIDGVLDQIHGGNITNEDELKAAAGHLRPAVYARLRDQMLQIQGEDFKSLAHSPEYQQEVVGKVSTLLGDYNPDGKGFDESYVKIDALIRTLPEGSAIRTELSKNLRDKRDGATDRGGSNYELAVAAIDQAAKAGRFGPIKPDLQKTAKAINDGFLRNATNLGKLGFSPEQIAEIDAPVPTKGGDEERPPTDTERRHRFERLWEFRKGKITADAYALAVARAIVDQESEIPNRAEDDKVIQTERKIGEMKLKLEEWKRANPNASAKDFQDQLKRIGAGVITLPTESRYGTAPRRQPTETSMTVPAPLQPLVPVFETAGRQHGLDPRLLAAIAMHETGNGTSSAFRNKNNAMGVSNARGPIAFSRVEDSIERMARVLSSSSGPYRHANTLEEIAKVYAPVGAGNDPRGLNRHWLDGVSRYYRALGGDPSAPIKS